MEKPFAIQFNFPLEGSKLVIPIMAVAELHHSVPYYKVHSFRSAGNKAGSSYSILPEQEIIKLEKEGEAMWVHKDSKKPTLLSEAIGKAIDQMNGEQH